jgi:hypothetical protein
MTPFMIVLLNNVTVGPVHNGAINNLSILFIYRQMNVCLYSSTAESNRRHLLKQ